MKMFMCKNPPDFCQVFYLVSFFSHYLALVFVCMCECASERILRVAITMSLCITCRGNLSVDQMHLLVVYQEVHMHFEVIYACIFRTFTVYEMVTSAIMSVIYIIKFQSWVSAMHNTD